MKKTLLGLGVLMIVSPAFAAKSKIVLPYTMDSASVQAQLKAQLYKGLEDKEEGFSGSYSKVVLEDKKSKITCEENSPGMLAVQQYQCTIETK